MPNFEKQNASVPPWACTNGDISTCRYLSHGVPQCRIIELRNVIADFRSGHMDPKEKIIYNNPYPVQETHAGAYLDEAEMLQDKSLQGMFTVEPSHVRPDCPKGFSDRSAAQALNDIREELKRLA